MGRIIKVVKTKEMVLVDPISGEQVGVMDEVESVSYEGIGKKMRSYSVNDLFLDVLYSDKLTRMQLKLFFFIMSDCDEREGVYWVDSEFFRKFSAKMGYSEGSVKIQFYALVKTGIVQRVKLAKYMINPMYVESGNIEKIKAKTIKLGLNL